MMIQLLDKSVRLSSSFVYSCVPRTLLRVTGEAEVYSDLSLPLGKTLAESIFSPALLICYLYTKGSIWSVIIVLFQNKGWGGGGERGELSDSTIFLSK